MNAMMATLSRPFAAVGQGLSSIGSGVMRFVSGGSYSVGILLGRTSINYMSEVGDGTKNPIVVAVTSWIAKNFPEAPIVINRENEDGTTTRIPRSKAGPGAMIRLIENPNPYFSGVLQWIATIIDFYTRGDGYWFKIRNGPRQTDRVVELWWIPWHMVKPYWQPGSGRFIDYYIYTVDGVQYRVETWNVVHFRDGIDPLNPRCGLSKLASLFREIFTDDEAANFTAVLLKNFAVPGVILAPSNVGGAVGKVDPAVVKQKYQETFGGDERGGVMAMSTPTDVKVVSWSPQQMNLKDLRRIPEERITAVFGVSAIVAGLGAGLDRSTFTNFGEARRAAYQESIVPLQRLIAADLMTQLLDDFADVENDTLVIGWDTSKASALQEALDAVWKRLESAATKGLITRAAFKQGTGQPSKPGEDDVYIRPNNFIEVPVGEAAPTSPPPPVTPSTPPQFQRGETVSDLRCQGDYRGETCGQLLASTATAPYSFTCRRCKTVTESAAAELVA